MKIKKTLLAATLFSALLTPFSSLRAQDNPIIIEVGGQKIHQDEFMQNFMQSVGDKLVANPTTTEQEKRKALEEYVELYANFRAKVIDAKSMGLDTSADLRKELSHYRSELAAPYLIDSTMLSRILHEAYERNRYALHAAHILVKLSPDVTGDDTMQSYGRAMHLYRRATEGGENFFALAHEQVLRDRPDAPPNPYEGELSYFTTFNMVYPFENAAYALEVGQVCKPVRTRYGYHVIKLIDKVEAYGKVTLQHIWKRDPNNQAAIRDIYDRMLSGTSFEMAARESDDYSTSQTGGYITDASFNQLPHEYVKTLSMLREGEVSRPFLTRYGWHIVKLVKRDTLPSYQAMVPYYKQRMSRDPRGTESRKAFARDARKKYGIIDYTVTPAPQPAKKGRKKQPVEMMASLDEMVSLMNDSLFRDLWRFKADSIHDRRTLVHTPSKDYNAVDLARHIRRNQRAQRPEPYEGYVRRHYDNFVDSVTIVYADTQIEIENPDFASLVEDYRNGLMIFNYNEKMIWSKAIYDTVGFADFYARESRTKRMDRPEDSIYFWRTRARVLSFHVADAACLPSDKATTLVRKLVKKGRSSTEIKEALLAKVNTKKCSAQEPVSHSIDVVEQTRQELLSPDQWHAGIYCVPEAPGYRVMVVEEIMPPMLKEQMEARGYYLNAWQNEVEENLMQDLRRKYNVSINHDAVSKITY